MGVVLTSGYNVTDNSEVLIGTIYLMQKNGPHCMTNKLHLTTKQLRDL